jgi:hypothetical protein
VRVEKATGNQQNNPRPAKPAVNKQKPVQAKPVVKEGSNQPTANAGNTPNKKRRNNNRNRNRKPKPNTGESNS